MSEVINAAHLFNSRDNRCNLDLVMSMATVYCPLACDLYELIRTALVEVIADPRFPTADLNRQAIMHCDEIIQQEHREATESILIHSYLTFCQMYDWDPLELAACQRVTRFYKHYLSMRQTLSILTLALILSADPD